MMDCVGICNALFQMAPRVEIEVLDDQECGVEMRSKWWSGNISRRPLFLVQPYDMLDSYRLV